jgi:hypothetical protein
MYHFQLDYMPDHRRRKPTVIGGERGLHVFIDSMEQSWAHLPSGVD